MYAVPAAHGSFPTLSLKVFPWMLDPLPRRYHRVLICFFHGVIGLPQDTMGRLPASVPRITTSRRVVFRGCRYFVMFRPPSLLAPQIVPTAALLPQGSRGFYVRAYRALLPPHAPDMLTVRRQVIDGTGTCTLLDSQPCRLLQCRTIAPSRPCPAISNIFGLDPPSIRYLQWNALTAPSQEKPLISDLLV